MRNTRCISYGIAVCVCALAALRCEKTYLPVESSGKINYLQGNTTADIVLQFLDRHSFAPLPDVRVAIVGGDSATSDKTGIVVFDSLPVGEYLITCHKPGFQSAVDNVSLSVDSNSNTVPIVNQSTTLMYMARTGAAIKGNVYYRKDKTLYPVDGAAIECLLTNPSLAFQTPIITATSAGGTYSIGDLPEYSTYTIRIMPFTAGSFIYKQVNAVSLSGQASGDTLRAQDIVMTQFTDGQFIVLDHNLATFTKTDSLKFEFSEAVDLETVGPDSMYVTMNNSSARILTNKIWQDRNTKLTIVPFDGNWNGAQVYTLVMRKIKSITGKPLDNTEFMAYSFSPTVTGQLGNVKNIRFRIGMSDTAKVDYNTSSITVVWSRLDNASMYQVYQKSSTDSAWTSLSFVSDTMASIATSGRFTFGNIVKVLVLGKNSTTVSPFETAPILTLRDTKGPYIYNSYTQSISGFNRTSYNGLDTVDVFVSSYIPEPMDTAKKPTIRVKEASYVSGLSMYGDSLYSIDPSRCYWTWTSPMSGVMHCIVDPLKNGSYDSLKIDFTGLTDWVGNKVDTTARGGYLNYYTSY
jgi:hypothetical protein